MKNDLLFIVLLIMTVLTQYMLYKKDKKEAKIKRRAKNRLIHN
ncbi:hypothetical protein [Deferribacter desulfuricans]|nr:hypothetical protein [Deferribacter desulfuricans]